MMGTSMSDVFHIGGIRPGDLLGEAEEPSLEWLLDTGVAAVRCVDIDTPTALGSRGAVPEVPLGDGCDEASSSQAIVDPLLAQLPFLNGYDNTIDPDFERYLIHRDVRRLVSEMLVSFRITSEPVEFADDWVVGKKNRRFFLRKKAFRPPPIDIVTLTSLFSPPDDVPADEDTDETSSVADSVEYVIMEKPPGVESDGLTYFTKTLDQLPVPGLIVGVDSPGVWPSLDRPIPQYGLKPGVTQSNSVVPLDSLPSRVMRGVYRSVGPVFWDSSLEMSKITFRSGDWLYGRLEDLDPVRFGYTVKGYVDLRVVSSVLGSGYRHRLGPPVVIRQEVGDRNVWVFREILAGDRRQCSLPRFKGLECFERSLTNYVIMPQRERLEVYLEAISGDPRAAAKARWDLVIHFTLPQLVAQMRSLRDADLAKEQPVADPIACRQQLEAAYAHLLYERPPNLPLYTA